MSGAGKFTDAKETRILMNEFGARREPFFFAVDFEMEGAIFEPDPFGSGDVFFSMRGIGNKERGIREGLLPDLSAPSPSPSSTPAPSPSPSPVAAAPEPSGFLSVDPIGYQEYLEKFGVVRRGLLRGDSFLVNLTVRTPVRMRDTLTMASVFVKSDSLFQFYLPGGFVCFSPETFVTMRDGEIATHPMKGTIDASVPDAGEKILNDFKESAEHATIVDLMRNDLSVFSTDVRVARYRYLDLLKTSEREILQVSSEVRGKLPPDWEKSLGDAIFGLLPPGSCSGAPKESTLRIIREAEGEKRGYYTGVAGLFDGEGLDSAVLIRFIREDARGNHHFRSGGGVTAYSSPEDEYREALEKIYLPFSRIPGKG
ncbi:MAG: aminodeoxychorismate synthase component I [Deltaproteobacteria bacterium]|jgi:para-aminobenzoate synthetase component 1|nr:aminodeoxychorismate synthase component I [Deltaproteobacteria bacterium]